MRRSVRLKPYGESASVNRVAFMEFTAQNVGSRIRTLRLERGISLRTFALMVNLDKSHLSRIERGEVDLKVNSLGKIISGLGMSPEEFFAWWG